MGEQLSLSWWAFLLGQVLLKGDFSLTNSLQGSGPLCRCERSPCRMEPQAGGDLGMLSTCCSGSQSLLTATLRMVAGVVLCPRQAFERGTELFALYQAALALEAPMWKKGWRLNGCSLRRAGMYLGGVTPIQSFWRRKGSPGNKGPPTRDLLTLCQHHASPLLTASQHPPKGVSQTPV